MRSVGDALLRRTRVGLLAAREVADRPARPRGGSRSALGPELGWDERRIDAEARAFLEEADAEGIAAAA